MNPFKSQNIVAKILQVYAYLNAICGWIIASHIAEEYSNLYVAILVFAAVTVASFLLFAFGEIIDLLYKINCKATDNVSSISDDDLPEL